MDIIYLFRTLLKRKWIIIFATILAAGFAFFLTQNNKKKYRSFTQVSTGFTISDKIAIGTDNFDLYEADTKFNNAVVTITSPSVINLLAYKLILHDLEEKDPFTQLTEKDKESVLYKEINKDEAKRIFRDRLENMNLLTSYKPEEKKMLEFLRLYGYDYKNIMKQLVVYRVQHTDYIQMDFVSENPELSAFAINNLYEQFIRYYKKIRSTTSQESLDTLKNIMHKRKEELDFKKALMAGAGIASANMESTSTYDLISNFEQSLATEQANLANLQASLRKVENRLANFNSQTAPVVSDGTNDELIVLRNEVNEAYRNYVSSGSNDQALLARYNRLKKQYQDRVAETKPGTATTTEKLPETKTELLAKKNDLQIDIQTSINNISSLKNKIGALRGAANSNAARGASAETLLKEVEQANSEYLLARQKYNDAFETSSSSANNFRQLLMAQPAIAPEPSKRLLIVGLAGGAAMLASVLIILLVAYLDSSIKTPGIFTKAINLKLINMINLMDFKKNRISDIVVKKDDAPRYAKAHNIFRECLRKLRYEIESSGKRIILFASTKKGQGKTTIITGLSYSFSMSKKRILIIDTNFCNNDLTVYLGAVPSLEQLEYDSKRPLVEQVFEKAVTIDDNKRIFVIGCQAGDFTPSEVLPADNLLKHLHELTNSFDYIFLEGPPLNDFSDAKELSQYVDGVIGVFSASDSIKQIDSESLHFFKSLEGKYTGSVLNMVDLQNVNTA
ncbi:MAG: Wzz/FepE/Etk N-terminal domain-containing protein [Lacibacter sp.]